MFWFLKYRNKPAKKALTREVKFDEIPRFPAITRDIALEVPTDLPNGKLEDFFTTRKEPLLTAALLFDLFADPTGQKLAPDKKSLAYTLTYRNPTKTLSTTEAIAGPNLCRLSVCAVRLST